MLKAVAFVSLVGWSLLAQASTPAPIARASPLPDPALGGATTVFETGRRAFSLPAANMAIERRARFAVGHAFFNQNWVEAPASTTSRDGLGPHFIGRSCTACHTHDGRGAPPEPGEMALGLLFRLSIPGQDAHGGPLPEPTYGEQFNNQAVDGVKPEGQVELRYRELPGKFADGETYSLRQPQYRFSQLGYGPMHPKVQVSPRLAQQLIGLGLLEGISDADILALADPEDRDNDGISGKANRVWDQAEQRMRLGRFGWKANTPSILHQTAGAAKGDIGLTSRLFPNEECMPKQRDCLTAPRGGPIELEDKNLDSLVFYTQTLAVPAQRGADTPDVQQGYRLFNQLQCQSCHVERHQTGELAGLPELSNQQFRPFTDMLLHDLGEGLADNRPDFAATGREWRTPPLWGIGLIEQVNQHTSFLHDGRARNLTEAILWHGGEAQAAKDRFVALTRAERQALLAFLNSL